MKRHTVRTRAKMGGATVSGLQRPKELKLKKSERDDIKDLLNIIQSKNWLSLPTYFERFDDTQIQLLCEALNLHKLTKRNREEQVRGLIKKIKTGGKSVPATFSRVIKWVMRVYALMTAGQSGLIRAYAKDKKTLELIFAQELLTSQNPGHIINNTKYCDITKRLLKDSGTFRNKAILSLLLSEGLLPKLESWIKNKNQHATLRKLQTEIQSFKR